MSLPVHSRILKAQLCWSLSAVMKWQFVAFFIGLLWWLMETGGCSLQMATYQSGIIVMTEQPMTDIKPGLGCFYVTLLKIQKYFYSLLVIETFHLIPPFLFFFLFSSLSRLWCGYDSFNLIYKMQYMCIYIKTSPGRNRKCKERIRGNLKMTLPGSMTFWEIVCFVIDILKSLPF